jgi:acyl-coenzyme A synthetase/AMP-(fatty) acid ligase
MSTIEFTAVPEAGVIPIPKEYRDEITGEVRVIVRKQDGRKMGKELQKELERVFEKYAGVTPFQEIDPVTWQREQRREWHKRTS